MQRFIKDSSMQRFIKDSSMQRFITDSKIRNLSTLTAIYVINKNNIGTYNQYHVTYLLNCICLALQYYNGGS